MPQIGVNMLPTQNPQQSPIQGVVTPQTTAGGASPEPSFNITNKKTGENKTVTVSQAKQMGFDDKFINDKLTASSALRKTIETPDPLSKTDQARHDALQTALSSLDSASQNLVAGGGAKGQILGSVAVGPLGQILDPKGAAYHNTKIELATQLAKAITGGSRPSGDVIQQYLHSLPDVNEDPKYVQSKLDKLYSELTNQAQSFKFKDLVDQYGSQGANASQDGAQTTAPTNQASTGENPIAGLLKGAYNTLLKPAVDNIGNYAKDIGAGTGQRLGGGDQGQAALKGADAAYQKAQTVSDPAEKARLLKVAQDTYKTVDANTQKATSAYSPDINQDYLTRGINTGSSIATLADLGVTGGKALLNPKSTGETAVNAVKNVLGKGGDVGSAIGNLFKGGDKSVLQEGVNLISEGGKIRDAAIKTAEEAGKTIDGSTLVKGLQEWGQKAIKAGEDAATVNKQVEQGVSSISNKALTPSDAKALWDTASQGFKDSGKAGNTVLSGYQRALRDSLRSELEKVAPGFEKGTAQMTEGFGKSKLLKQVSDSLQKSEIKSNLRSPLQKLLGNGVVRTAGAAAVGGEFINLLRGK